MHIMLMLLLLEETLPMLYFGPNKTMLSNSFRVILLLLPLGPKRMTQTWGIGV